MLSRSRDAETLRTTALKRGWKLLLADNWLDGLRILAANQRVGVVLVDRQMLRPSWQDSLRTLLYPHCQRSVVVVSPATEDQFWETLIRHGAYDVLKTPLLEEGLIRTVEFAWLCWKVSATAYPR